MTKLDYTDPSYTQALDLFSSIVGENGILSDRKIIADYSNSCGTNDTLPCAIIYPENTEQVCAALKIANDFGIKVHPISQGKNWGYGAACAAQSGSIVFDLGRMNQIVEFSEELAYVVVEPGVTQEQLFNFLEGKNVTMDVTGSSPEASILGNLTERGYGQTTYGDHFLHSASMEVVLADGTLIQTGFGHYPKNKARHLYKWGIGPYLDGLFTQSNFGIVTKVGIWLMRKESRQGALLISVDSDEQMIQLAVQLRELKLRGILPSTIHLSNDVRVISSLEQFPFDKLPNETKLTEEIRKQLRNKWQVGLWNCFAGLKGSPRGIKTALAEVREVLRGIAKVEFISDRKVSLLKKVSYFCPQSIKGRLKKSELLLGLVTGRPSIRPLLGAYWRKQERATMPYNPTRDNCGIIWCAPIIPTTKKDIDTLLRLTSTCLEAFGFDFNVTLTLIAERACCATIGIVFDSDSIEEKSRATDCYKQLLQHCLDQGYAPYRFGNAAEHFKNSIFDPKDNFWKLCNKLKNCVDPKGIINPGKYALGSGSMHVTK